MKTKGIAEQNFEPSVVCPYCGYEPDETYPEPNGDWDIEECSRCEKMFKTAAYIEYTSKRNCELNKLECDWQPCDEMNFFDKEKPWYKCLNCLNTKIERASNENT